MMMFKKIILIQNYARQAYKNILLNDQQNTEVTVTINMYNNSQSRTQQSKLFFDDDQLSLGEQDFEFESGSSNSIQNKMKQDTPQFQEIERCMSVISSLMPQMFPQAVLKHFYNKLMTKVPQKLQRQKERIINNKQIEVKLQNDNLQGRQNKDVQTRLQSRNQQNQNQTKNKISPIKRQRVAGLTQAEWQQRKEMIKIIGECFSKDRNFQAIQQEVNKKRPQYEFNSTIYSQLLQQLLLQTLKYVQNIVIDGYSIKGGNIVCAQDKSISRIMANCRYKLSPQVCQIIFKAVQQYGSQGLVIMSKQEGMRMLKGINEGLTKKADKVFPEKLFKINSQLKAAKVQDAAGLADRKYKFQLHKMWNKDFQKLMLDMYKNGSKFDQIRERLRLSYPKVKDIFTTKALRSMFFKILRIAIRRLLKQYKQRSKFQVQMIHLTDQLVKNIINYSECKEIRKLLIEIYRSQNCPRSKIQLIIMKINQYANSGGILQKAQARSLSSYDQQ